MILLLAFFLATIPQPPNTVQIGAGSTLCGEATQCVVTATSVPATLWFGVGSTWCSTGIVNAKFPLTVSWSTPNPTLCAADPSPGQYKVLLAVQQAAPYTVSYTLKGVAQAPFTVTALPPPPKTLLQTLSCTGTIILSVWVDSSGNKSFTLDTPGTTLGVACTSVTQ
jgi:hypothetical protein